MTISGVGRVLVQGFGSIGARHARVLVSLGAEVVVLSRRAQIDWPHRVTTFAEGIALGDVSHVVLANETAAHADALRSAREAGYDGPVLVEKPLFHAFQDDPIATLRPDATWVAYNLRFHPAIEALAEALRGARLISATCHVGQDLRSWRIDRPLKASYSGNRALGGGVLRDLSHELDYATLLFGRWAEITANVGHFGPLPIDSDDCCDILSRTDRCSSVTIHMDYHQQPAMRRIIVQTEDATYLADLVANRLTGGGLDMRWEIDRDFTYRAMHEAFLAPQLRDRLCSFDDGLDTVITFDAVERASQERIWISR